MDKKERLVCILIIIVATIVFALCLWGAIHYGVKDHNLQIEQFGFVKSDFTALSFWENFLKNTCIVVAILVGIGLLGVVLFTITEWKPKETHLN